MTYLHRKPKTRRICEQSKSKRKTPRNVEAHNARIKEQREQIQTKYNSVNNKRLSNRFAAISGELQHRHWSRSTAGTSTSNYSKIRPTSTNHENFQKDGDLFNKSSPSTSTKKASKSKKLQVLNVLFISGRIFVARAQDHREHHSSLKIALDSGQRCFLQVDLSFKTTFFILFEAYYK
jgi:hypothetical protein